MRISFDPKKIRNILFITAVSLLIINLLADKLFFSINPETPELTLSEIEPRFKSSLSNLGIQSDWIKELKTDENSVKLSVRIPYDLPIVLILQELNNAFDTNHVKINSLEKEIGGKTILNLISGSETKLTAELNYNNKVLRKTARIGFLVSGFGLEVETDSLLLQFPEQYACMLVPSKSSGEAVKKILKYGKEFVVLLNDEIDELEFKMSENYSAIRLKNSIREIVGTFPQAVFFLIDNSSDLYNSKVYTLIKEELEKRKIRLIEGNNFVQLSNRENLSDIFKISLDNMSGGEDKIFIIDAEDFLSLNSEVIKYRKLGYKFTNPSAMLF